MRVFILVLAWFVIITGSAFLIYDKLLGFEEEVPEITEIIPIEQPEIKKPKTLRNATPAITEKTQTYEDYLKLGDSFLADNFIDSAIIEYKKVLELTPRSVPTFIKLGNAYLLNNNPKEAQKTFLNAQKLDSDSQEVKIGLIQAHLNLREAVNAKKIIQLLDQNNAEVKYYNAIIAIVDKDYEKAKALFEKIQNSGCSIGIISVISGTSSSNPRSLSYIKKAEPVIMTNHAKTNINTLIT